MTFVRSRVEKPAASVVFGSLSLDNFISGLS